MTARIVVAGTGSGAGKTTIASGLIGALRARGLRVQGFKVGPDYIDPSYHALASGRPGRNLDAFLAGSELIAPLFRHGAAGADVAVIEGVMGLFDGATASGELASTAQIAKLLRAPVALVVDGSAMARSAAAIVHGFRSFDPELEIAAVIFNRIGSDAHEQILRDAVEPLGVPVLGALRQDERLSAPERHLGLVPVAEREPRTRDALDALAGAVAERVDLDALLALARDAPAVEGEAWVPGAARPAGDSVRVALAAGPVFSFHYRENLELLEAAGAELLPFDPLADAALPAGTEALVLAGGFPEVFGAELAANRPLRAAVAAHAAAGRPIVAECGGLLYLCEQLEDHEMCGVLPLRAGMGGGLTLGYREAVAATATPWLPAGAALRGHEFHWTEVAPAPAAPPPAWTLSSEGAQRTEGFVRGAVQASYLHVHWAAFPQIPRAFVEAARRQEQER